MAKIAAVYPGPPEKLSQCQAGEDNCGGGDHPEYRDERRCDHFHPEKSCDKTDHERPREGGLEDDYQLFFSFPEPSGSVQTDRRENEMPAIEESEKHENVQQFDAHGKERGEGGELRQMPGQDGGHQEGKGEHARVEQHEHLEKDLTAKVCHAGIRSKLVIVQPKVRKGFWKSRWKPINGDLYAFQCRSS